MALDATPTGTSSNSYGTAAEADEYFTNRRLNGSAWVALSSTVKDTSLIMACNILERGFTWEGGLRIWNQRLSWPRSGVLDFDGRQEAIDTVPQGVKEAQFELAFALARKDRFAAQEPELLGQGFSRVKAGEVEVVVDDEAVLPLIPQVVVTLLERYGYPKDGVMGNGLKQNKLYR